MVSFCGDATGEEDNDRLIGKGMSSSVSTLFCSREKSLVKANGRTRTYHLLEAWERDTSTCKRDLEHLFTLVDAGAIDPIVLDRVPLSKISRAHELLSLNIGCRDIWCVNHGYVLKNERRYCERI